MAYVVAVWTIADRGPQLRGIFSDGENADRFLDDLAPTERACSHATRHTLDEAYLHVPKTRGTTAAHAA